MFRERDQFNCEIDDDQDMAANLKDFNEMNVNQSQSGGKKGRRASNSGQETASRGRGRGRKPKVEKVDPTNIELPNEAVEQQ